MNSFFYVLCHTYVTAAVPRA